MSSSDNLPFFPNVPTLGVPHLTKREWFAGMALQGMLANGSPESKDLRKKELVMLAIEYADMTILGLSMESS